MPNTSGTPLAATTNDRPPVLLPSPWIRSWSAARANLLPGLILQSAALAIVVAYYLNADFRLRLDAMAAWKAHFGYAYSAVATALFGGVIPFLYLRLRPSMRSHATVGHGFFLLGFWAFRGVEVDALYRVQGMIFGTDPEPLRVAAKVLVDQFVYNPFWNAPTALLAFRWKDLGFSWRRFRSEAWSGVLRDGLPSALLSTWFVWVPTVAIVYSLPATLQIPLFNIVLCFWSLLFLTLTGSGAAPAGRGSDRDS